jgi:hypothetical protein
MIATIVLTFTCLYRPTCLVYTYCCDSRCSTECKEEAGNSMGKDESGWKEVGAGGSGDHAESAL